MKAAVQARVFSRRLSRFKHETSGATGMEYGLLAAFLAVAITAGAPIVKAKSTAILDKLAAGLTAELQPSERAVTVQESSKGRGVRQSSNGQSSQSTSVRR